MAKQLLLHACCAPCSIAIIDELKNQYDLTVLFYNPNIFPKNEYEKRKAEVIRVCDEWSVPFIDLDYEHESWKKAIAGMEGEPESGKRCAVCFASRLKRTAEYAKENNIKIFASSLTSGRNKNADIIGGIGKRLADEFGLEFLDENWKSKGRQEKGQKLTSERGIYRQNYCGCEFSLSVIARSPKGTPKQSHVRLVIARSPKGSTKQSPKI